MATKKQLAEIKKLQANVANQKKLVKDLTTKATRAAEFADKTVTKAERSSEPLTNKSVKPDTPAGTKAVWVGGTDTGSWKFESTTGGDNGGEGGDNDAKAKYDKEQAALALKAEKEAEKRDAFALIEDTMRAYGFNASEMGELNTYIQGAIINPNLGPQGAILGMKQLNVYKQRFAGNETLVKTGKNALSEYDYLQQENAYSEYLKAYGVENLGNRETFATLIGNSVSGTEVQKRVSTAVDRVKNSDPQIMAQLKTYYPTLTDTDLVSYFLNPKQALPDLQRKVTASEIGAAAVGQGFRGATDALGLADYGVDRATALAGYSNIADVLPEATKLGDIYGETGVKYTQQSGEEEFLKQNEAAKRKRNILASKERANFEGSAGNAPGAYSTSYLRKSSSSGLI